MKKGISAKVFILAASILVLAHAVIPHLHFNHKVYIITSACISDITHKHNAPEHNHESDGNRDCCLLNQVVLIPTDDLNFEFQTPANQKSIDLHFALNAVPESDIFIDNFCSSGPPDFNLPCLYTELVDCSVNLRGSPLV